jgi:hypothetical protein
MSSTIFSYSKKLLPIIGVAIFIYLLYSLNIEDILASLLRINPLFLLFAVSLTLPRVLIRNYAWQCILQEQNIKITFYQSLKIFLIGFFYGSITPGYIGQLVRVPYLKEKTKEPYGKLFVNSVLEVVIHTLSLYGMMVLGSLLIFGSIPELFYITLLWILILACVLFFFLKQKRGEHFFFTLIKYLIPKKLKQSFNLFVGAFYKDFPHVHKLLFPLLLGIFTWVLIFSQEYLVVIALGLPIPYLFFLLLYPIANTAGFLPITFAGLGTRELTAIAIFSTLFSVTAEDIFVLSLVGFLITDIFTGAIGFVFSVFETKYSQ